MIPFCVRAQHPLYNVGGQKDSDSMGKHVTPSLTYIESLGILLLSIFGLEVQHVALTLSAQTHSAHLVVMTVLKACKV